MPDESNRTDALPTGDDLPEGSKSEALPQIADHVLIRRIGAGAYGEVWLARNLIGGFHAVKVIYRKKFTNERPYQREFEGMCKFEPISRSHPGLVTILQVGQNEQAGYFYYVMELADDARTGQAIDTDAYLPRTLKQEMETHPHRPLDTSLQIALSLTSALGYLHEQRLIHRDIKPSNIIFVNGVPKIADIGLITEAGEDVSKQGTHFYMPSEELGEPAADIFGLGKVFYELFWGLHPKHYPELPDAAEEFTTVPELLRINNLILKACHHDRRQRFQTTKELHKALQAVSETVQEKRPETGTAGAAVSGSLKRGAGTGTKTALREGGVDTGKATRDPTEGRPVASGEQRPKARWTRRAALLVLLTGTTVGAFFFGKLQKSDSVRPDRGLGVSQVNPGRDTSARAKPAVPPSDPVVVLMDTTAVGGIYDGDNKAKGISNAEELKKVLELILDFRWLNAVPLSSEWKSEDAVVEMHPRLVIVHRSAFFHSYNAFFQYGQPPQFAHPTNDERWVKLYGFADEKLINLLAYIAAREPQTQFLVYSRGTDPNWMRPGFQEGWKHIVESRFQNLKGRVKTMTVKRGKDDSPPTFRNPDVQKELLELVTEILAQKPEPEKAN